MENEPSLQEKVAFFHSRAFLWWAGEIEKKTADLYQEALSADRTTSEGQRRALALLDRHQLLGEFTVEMRVSMQSYLDSALERSQGVSASPQ